MGAHGVRQPRQQARAVTAARLITVAVAVTMTVVMAVVVIVVRAVRALHNIQHARINALPHIDKNQGRALAN
jgi:hypothetical protein